MPVLNPYASLVELLGKPHEDLTITRFIDQLGERPRIHREEITCSYHFSVSGFEIMALKNEKGSDKHIHAVTFFVDTTSVRDGSVKPYRYEFTSGVTPNDSLKDVRNKISLKPTDWFAETIPKLRYDYPHHTLHFHFREPDGEKMVLASLRLAQDNRHFDGQVESN